MKKFIQIIHENINPIQTFNLLTHRIFKQATKVLKPLKKITKKKKFERILILFDNLECTVALLIVLKILDLIYLTVKGYMSIILAIVQ